MILTAFVTVFNVISILESASGTGGEILGLQCPQVAVFFVAYQLMTYFLSREVGYERQL